MVCGDAELGTGSGHRRDFLRGKLAADAVPAGPPGVSGTRQPEELQGADYLIRVGRRAMACQFEVCLNAGQAGQGTQAALDALDLVDALEQQLSYFRSDSELAVINRTAALGPVPVEPRLFELLQLVLRMCAETGGAYDVTAAPLWELWGFAQRAGRVPNEEEIAAALSRVGSQWVELDAARKTIHFRREGVRLNLGSIGKGYALDRCAERLRRAGIDDFLMHGGYSSMIARGSHVLPGARAAAPGSAGAAPQPTAMPQPIEQPTSGWIVGIRHPLRPERRVAEIRLADRALSTSGAWAQSFWHEGRRYGHILDPRTGWPAEGVLSATAIAPTASLAEALSTALYVLGLQAAREYCEQRPELGAVLICPVRHSGGIEIHTIGLREGDVTILQ